MKMFVDRVELDSICVRVYTTEEKLIKLLMDNGFREENSPWRDYLTQNFVRGNLVLDWPTSARWGVVPRTITVKITLYGKLTNNQRLELLAASVTELMEMFETAFAESK